ncbi:MAG: hypothetical protein LIO77_09670 [Rikenellaceae bacterium]|nr:hypothetical protein [Rikenellaceae bacterium]
MAGSDIVRSVADKVERLMGENRRLRAEASRLGARNDKLKGENRELAERIVHLEQRLNILELKEGLASGGNTKAAMARVNRLMREVDKCIALLNRQP